MAWAKVDDQWFAHRKVVGLSLAARGLWTTVLSWTCAQRSPQVPTHMVAFLAAGADVEPLTAELVAAGLWHPVDGGWQVHDWAQYQERPSDEARASGTYGNHVRWHVNRASVDPECKHCTGDDRPDSPPIPPDDRPEDPGESEPDRSRPVPSRPETPSAVGAREALAAAISTACRQERIPPPDTRPRQQLDVAAADIAAQGGEPHEVPGKAREFRRQWPDATLTPMALAKHWLQLVPETVDSRPEAKGYDPTPALRAAGLTDVPDDRKTA